LSCSICLLPSEDSSVGVVHWAHAVAVASALVVCLTASIYPAGKVR